MVSLSIQAAGLRRCGRRQHRDGNRGVRVAAGVRERRGADEDQGEAKGHYEREIVVHGSSSLEKYDLALKIAVLFSCLDRKGS